MIQEEGFMNRNRVLLGVTAFMLAAMLGIGFAIVLRQGNVAQAAPVQGSTTERVTRPYSGFQVEVLVNGRPVAEYHARGRTYVEALQGAEYELRVRNSSPDRVAVALSVDGLNTIDARHTSAWNASKWVIEPYQTITISGWQMSSERARRFYFTNERDSYGAKLGQTANLGVISAVFFKERRRITPVTPPYPIYRDDSERSQSRSEAPAAESRKGEGVARDNRAVVPRPDEDYAATGIGRSVRNDVRWVNLELDSRAAAEVTVRYEYYSALLRLGVVPRQSREPYPLHRREDSRGFSPEP
jgi:hypothetical protein